MKKDKDAQVEWILKHGGDLAMLLETPGWALLKEKAIEDITNTMETIFSANTSITPEIFNHAKGYVAGIKSILNFPEGAVAAMKAAEKQEEDDAKPDRRRRAIKLASS
jgi:hypothetical protein